MTNSNNKKQEPKSFDLAVRKPKVLLLGNGLSRAYNAGSWDHFLDSINRKKDEFPVPKDIDEIKEELTDYYGTAMVSGFPMAMANLNELENMDEDELRELAEKLGLEGRE